MGGLDAAWKALEEMQYPSAIRFCKQLLKQDRSNYEGFVVLGLALLRNGQLDQAEMSLKKAMTLNSSALEAYKGLIELRESIGNVQEMVEAYDTAAKAAGNCGEFDIFLTYAKKMAAHDHLRAKSLWQSLLDMNISEEQRVEALCCLVDAEAAVMEAHIREFESKSQHQEGHLSADNDDTKIFEQHLKDLVRHLPYSERYQNLLLEILIFRARANQGEVQQMLQHCLEMLSVCPSTAALNLLLAACEEDDADKIFRALGSDEETIKKHIAHLCPGNPIAAAALVNLTHSRSMKGVNWSTTVADGSTLTGWRVLASAYASEGLQEKACDFANSGLSVINSLRNSYGLKLKAAELQLHLVLADGLLSKSSYMEAEKLFHKIEQDASELSDEERQKEVVVASCEGAAKVSIALGDIEEAKKRLNFLLSIDERNHWALSELSLLALRNGDLHKAMMSLESAIAIFSDNAGYHYRLGVIYWKMNDNLKAKAVKECLESAKLAPDQPDSYLYLGHYYRDFAKDNSRAAKCYQKVVTSDPDNREAGEALCDILESGGQYILEKSVCENVSQKSTRAFWAYRRLGYIQITSKKWSEAVASIQHVLRRFAEDSCLWEALGLCYKRLGMFSSALKAFERAFDLDNSALFSAVEIGSIHLTLSSFTKAIDAFRQALQISNDEVTASYGLASALLGYARQCLAQNALAWSTSLLKEAKQVVQKIVLNFGNMTAAWKLLGDINVLYAQSLVYSYEECDFTIQSVEEWNTKRLSAAQKAVFAYKRALHLLPNEPSLYTDAAIAMELVTTLNNQHTTTLTNLSWSTPQVLACGALKMDCSNPDHWFNLGFVTNHLGLQQHAFIQALRLNGSHAIAWASLGQMYLQMHDLELAKQSFDKARTADPTLSLPWIGMSVIFSFRERKKDAFASCLCAADLSSNLTCQLALGQLAAQTKQLNLPQVYVALQQAVRRQPMQTEAHNFKGLASESRGDFESAIADFRRAIATLKFSSLKDSTATHSRLLAVTNNLVRVLCKAGFADVAVKEYGNVFSEYVDRSYAVSLWQSNRKSSAETVAEEILLKASDAAAASAGVGLVCKFVYWSMGASAAVDKLLKANDSLFHSTELCLVGISLAILSNAQDLLAATVQRCRSIFSSEYAVEAYVLLSSRSQLRPIQYLSKILHRHPDSHTLRAKLSEVLLLQSNGRRARLVERCCCTEENILSAAKVLTDATVACPSSLKDSILGQLKRIVHREPWNILSRYCLVLCLMQKAKEENFPGYICDTILGLSHTSLAHLSSSTQHMYMRMQLQLCASECCLQRGDRVAAVEYAMAAACDGDGHSSVAVQVARCGAAESSFGSGESGEVAGELASYVSMMDLELRNGRDDDDDDMMRKGIIERGGVDTWMGVMEFVIARCMLWKDDVAGCERAAFRALKLWPQNGLLHVYHGAVCMLMVKNGDVEYVSKGVKSLIRACDVLKGEQVRVVHALLAQAEANKVKKWAKNIRLEYSTWPAGERPAELYFQMAIVCKRDVDGDGDVCIEKERSYKCWLRMAIHLNPSCRRYWCMM